MNSIVYGIGNNRGHSHGKKQKNKQKTPKTPKLNLAEAETVAGVIAVECRNSPKRKKLQESRLCWVSLSQNWLGFFLELFSPHDFPDSLNFSVTPQIQKQAVPAGACLSQQPQNHTFLFSLSPPPSSPASQSLCCCLTFCIVQPMQA